MGHQHNTVRTRNKIKKIRFFFAFEAIHFLLWVNVFKTYDPLSNEVSLVLVFLESKSCARIFKRMPVRTLAGTPMVSGVL
jgi:hypothetical protein